MFWEKDKKEIQQRLKDIADKMELHDRENDRRLDNIEKVMLVQEQNLKEHMRRSEHLEDLVTTQKKESERKIAPIQKHINMVEGVFKFIGILGILTSVIGGILKILGII